MKNVLLLGSQSSSRQQLLKEASIPFVVIGHHSDEAVCNWQQPFSKLLKFIAVQKMEHVMVPEGKNDERCFVLTADTMGMDSKGIIHGKPKDKLDAITKIKALRGQGIVATAFCLEKKRWLDGQWEVEQRILNYVQASYEFDMPDAWIKKYFAAVPHYKEMSGGLTIEGFGAQFLKRIDGSYSTIIGLPMFELREALEAIGFFI